MHFSPSRKTIYARFKKKKKIKPWTSVKRNDFPRRWHFNILNINDRFFHPARRAKRNCGSRLFVSPYKLFKSPYKENKILKWTRFEIGIKISFCLNPYRRLGRHNATNNYHISHMINSNYNDWVIRCMIMVNDIESFELSLYMNRYTTRERGKYLHIKDLFILVPFANFLFFF